MKHFFYYLLLMLSTVLLTACDSHSKFKDLESFITNLDSQSPQKTSVPALNPLKPSSYQKDGGRTPFEDYAQPKGVATKTNHPLQMYQINLLRFVGTVSKNDQIYAYILTPDNKVFEVKKGDAIGDHNGKIMSITNSKVQVVEQPGEEDQHKTERIITLQLKDES